MELTRIAENKILVPMDEQAVAGLLSRRAPGETLADVIGRLCDCVTASDEPAAAPSAADPAAGKYKAVFLGESVDAETLPSLFARIVDMTSELDPLALERLASMKARTRRFVSRTRDAIHPGRPDLSVMRTRSGWWVSANVGTDDIVRALKSLADAAGLTFGDDIRFPLGNS